MKECREMRSKGSSGRRVLGVILKEKEGQRQRERGLERRGADRGKEA